MPAVEKSELPLFSFVVERYKIVYVPVAKASTTSMKWLVAALNGEDEQQFLRSIAAGTTRAATIHDRGSWQITPKLDQVGRRKLREIHPDAGWFVFAVTRHPTARLWSAWQSKFLLQQDFFMRHYRTFDWLPRVPTSTADVVEDFHRFVKALRGPDREPIVANRHFQRQTVILGRSPYSRLYKTSEVPTLLEDLAAHVRANGGPELPALILSNDTPLPLIRPLLTDDVLATVEEVYRDDLARLDFPDVHPSGVRDADEFTSAQLREVGRLVERNQRIGDLSREATRLRRELAKAQRGSAASDPDTADAADEGADGDAAEQVSPRAGGRRAGRAARSAP